MSIVIIIIMITFQVVWGHAWWTHAGGTRRQSRRLVSVAWSKLAMTDRSQGIFVNWCHQCHRYRKRGLGVDQTAMQTTKCLHALVVLRHISDWSFSVSWLAVTKHIRPSIRGVRLVQPLAMHPSWGGVWAIGGLSAWEERTASVQFRIPAYSGTNSKFS